MLRSWTLMLRAVRRSKSAPHMHVLVCICSNVRQFHSTEGIIHTERIIQLICRLIVRCLAVFCQPKPLARILLTGIPSPSHQAFALWLALCRPDLLVTVRAGILEEGLLRVYSGPRGGGILRNRISCLKPPQSQIQKRGGGGGGGLRGFFAARGYCPRKRPPGPPNPPPNEEHSVGHLRTVGYAAQV